MGKIIDYVYYNSEGIPFHKGIVEFDGKFYYADKNGKLVKDREKIVHSVMTHGLVKHGTYYFDKEGVLDIKSYKKPLLADKKKKYLDVFLPKKNRNTLLVAYGMAFFVVLIIISFFVISPQKDNTTNNVVDSKVQNSDKIEIVLPQIDNKVYLCSKAMENYYNGEVTIEEAIETRASAYRPFVFNYIVKNAISAVLVLSENDDYSDGERYNLDINETSISIDNLKTGTSYYYLVTAEDEEKKVSTCGGKFTTADTNRFISLPGVYNTRDIGGYDTCYDKKIKQGVLYRGTELDGLVESKYFLKDLVQIKKFGIVCEFDLRENDIFSSNYVSRLGKNVSHKFYNSPSYGEIFSKENKESLRKMFSDLADEKNYPMYMHCTYGLDRTGTIVFLLQGLLGVSEEDMVTEYKLSGFFNDEYAKGEYMKPIYFGL